jgi:hypothetical protein
MRARLKAIMSIAAVTTNPDPKDLSIEQLEDILGDITIATQSLNHALVIMHHNDWTMEKHMQFGPAAITLNPGRTPPSGIYSEWLHFTRLQDGFNVVVNGADRHKECFFTATGSEKGGFHFRTHNGDYNIVRKETLKSAHDVAEYFGAWMRRNFDSSTLHETHAWMEKLSASQVQTRSFAPIPVIKAP